MSAPFIQACRKAGLRPGADCDLSALRAIGSTGAPLSPEGFGWIAAELGAGVQICSVSGTDLCAAFLCAAPEVPVWAGELSCRALGAVPDQFIVIEEVPCTLNGKKCEVPVKRILAGLAPSRAVSPGALRNPDSLNSFVALRSGDRSR